MLLRTTLMEPRCPSSPITAVPPLPLEGLVFVGLSLCLGLAYALVGLAS